MTDIKIIKRQDGATIECLGHAHYNPGNDIVCAAISQLCCTIASLIEKEEDVQINEMHIDDGMCVISFEKCTKTALFDYVDFVIEGFTLLAENYPKNVNLKCVVEN